MINFLINMSDREFGEKLALRLSETSQRFRVDLDENRDGYDYVIDDEMQDDILPVSALSERIIVSYTEKTGKPFYGPEKALRKVFVFTSPMGGSGLSSAAFSFARILCGKTGVKTLYIDSGPPGRFMAGEYAETAAGTERELRYVVKEKRLTDPLRYLSRDHFGPFVICTEIPDAELIRQLADTGGFGQIIVSAPDMSTGLYENAVRIAVINVRDVRSAETENVPDGYDYLLRNRDYINNVSENIISVAEDPVSFKLKNGEMRISMSGEFGTGMEKLAKAVMGEDEQVFLWNMS